MQETFGIGEKEKSGATTTTTTYCNTYVVAIITFPLQHEKRKKR